MDSRGWGGGNGWGAHGGRGRAATVVVGSLQLRTHIAASVEMAQRSRAQWPSPDLSPERLLGRPVLFVRLSRLSSTPCTPSHPTFTYSAHLGPSRSPSFPWHHWVLELVEPHFARHHRRQVNPTRVRQFDSVHQHIRQLLAQMGDLLRRPVGTKAAAATSRKQSYSRGGSVGGAVTRTVRTPR